MTSYLGLIFLMFASAQARPKSRCASERALSEPIDLTHPVSVATIGWPTAGPFVFENLFQGVEHGLYFEINQFSQPEHIGTHIDAPAHFAEGQWHLGEIPFSQLHGPGVKIDISAKARDNWDSKLTVNDLKNWEAEHGRIPDNSVVLLFSDWAQYYPNKERFFGYPPGVFETNPQDTDNLHFPGFDPEACTWLIENRNIAGTGTDTASTDAGQVHEFSCHKAFGNANLWSLEAVANLDKLPAKGYTVYAMPHALEKGSGAPTRVMAVPDTAQGTNDQNNGFDNFGHHNSGHHNQWNSRGPNSHQNGHHWSG